MGEFTSLLLLLRVTLSKGIHTLQLFGDSDLTIRYMKGEDHIKKATLYNLASHLRVLDNNFN